MVKSKLAEQLAEAIPLAEKLNDHARTFGQLKANFAADLALGGDAGGGGGSSPILGPDGSPVSSIFLRPGRTVRLGEGVDNPGVVTENNIDVAAEAERLAELDAACRYFAIPVFVMRGAPRADQDRLLEKFRALGSPGYEPGFATQGGGGSSGGPRVHQDGGSRLPPDILGGAHGAAISAYTPLETQRSGVSESSSAAPAAAIQAGAQATVAALGSVVTELKRLNDNVAKKPTGVEFRTGGLT